jgi:hypothetical protein
VGLVELWYYWKVFCLLSFCCRMTTDDLSNLMPAQEKLEWVTPKISLMEMGATEDGKGAHLITETFHTLLKITAGPS